MSQIRETRDSAATGPQERKVRVGGTAYLTSYISSHGGDPKRVLSSVGLAAEDLSRADSWLDVEQLAGLWEAAAAELEDSLFGMRFARFIPLDSYGLLSYLVLNAPDVRTGAGNLARYGAALSFGPVRRPGLDVDGSLALLAFSLDVPTENSPYQLIEGQLVAMGRALEQLTADLGTAREYRVQHDLGDRIPEATRVLGHPVRCGCDHYGIAFDAALLDRPVVGADRDLLPLLERQLRDVTDHEGNEFLSRLREEVARQLPDGVPPLKKVARRLAMSERSVQRRLLAAGVTYKTAVLELRMELAQGYLEHPTIRIAEVAALLGYQEVSSFNHAFRRSRGVAPGAWRNRKMSA